METDDFFAQTSCVCDWHFTKKKKKIRHVFFTFISTGCMYVYKTNEEGERERAALMCIVPDKSVSVHVSSRLVYTKSGRALDPVTFCDANRAIPARYSLWLWRESDSADRAA